MYGRALLALLGDAVDVTGLHFTLISRRIWWDFWVSAWKKKQSGVGRVGRLLYRWGLLWRIGFLDLYVVADVWVCFGLGI